MPVKLAITCDTPNNERPSSSADHTIRCYGTVNEAVSAVVYIQSGSSQKALMQIATTYRDLRKLARFQGWHNVSGRFICPGCVNRLHR